MSRCLDTSSTVQMAKIMGENRRSCGTSRTKFVRSSISQIAMGKTSRASFIRTWMGEKLRTGNACSFIGKKDIWDAPRGNANQMKPSLNNTQNVRITPNFCWRNRQFTGMAKNARACSGVVLRHGETCSDMLSDTVSWQTRKWSNSAKFLILVWTTINSKTRKWNKLADVLHSSHKRFPTILSCGKHGTQTLQATLRSHSQPQEVSCVFLEAEHLSLVSWMCKKQTSVSHSSTESEIISLDAGLRVDGLFALDLWYIVIEVLRRQGARQHAGFSDLCAHEEPLNESHHLQAAGLSRRLAAAEKDEWKALIVKNIVKQRDIEEMSKSNQLQDKPGGRTQHVQREQRVIESYETANHGKHAS